MTRSVLLRGSGFAVLWFVFAAGDTNGWVLMAGTVVAATLVSLWLEPPRGDMWRPWGIMRLVLFFAWYSLWGGIDVARRALHPRLPVRPGFLVHESTLGSVTARRLFMAMVSLLPGTLSVTVQGDRVVVHALSTDMDVKETLRVLEKRIEAALPSPIVGRPGEH